jgi:hypothetical protein
MVAEAIQQKPADISQPPESEQQEKKVMLPKVKWAAEGGYGPLFSNWRWVCENSRGPFCALEDVNGRFVQSFQIENGILASEINVNALRPKDWGCGLSNGTLNCSIGDGMGKILQRCAYDGRSLACRN